MFDRLSRGIRAVLAPAPGLEPDNGGGLPWDAIYGGQPARVGLRSVQPSTVKLYTGSGASQLIAPANAGRVELTIYNASSVNVAIALGPIASSISATLTLAAGAAYVLEDPDCYQGDVSAVWSSGSLEVTERIRGG